MAGTAESLAPLATWPDRLKELEGAVRLYEDVAIIEHRRLKAYWRAQQESFRRKMEDRILDARLECLVASVEAFEAFDARREGLAAEHRALYQELTRGVTLAALNGLQEGAPGPARPLASVVEEARSRLLARSQSEGSLTTDPRAASEETLLLVRRAEQLLTPNRWGHDHWQASVERSVSEAEKTLSGAGESRRGQLLAELHSRFKSYRKRAGKGFDAKVRSERARHAQAIAGMGIFLSDLAL